MSVETVDYVTVMLCAVASFPDPPPFYIYLHCVVLLLVVTSFKTHEIC